MIFFQIKKKDFLTTSLLFCFFANKKPEHAPAFLFPYFSRNSTPMTPCPQWAVMVELV